MPDTPGRLARRKAKTNMLLTASDEDIEKHIDKNVNNLAEAKAFLKELTKMTRDIMTVIEKG